MENQKLPNATAVLVLGILSIVTCCCYGIIGLILGIVALVLAKKDKALYLENPELYSNYSNLNTGRILAIIGIVLSTIYLIANIYFYVTIGQEGLMEMQQQWIEQMQAAQ
ncbi:CCC motif membrane protein [Flavobacterium soli]|uniref:CCC motif membrane protein n=1 Tax=Flavobacterium soli TaxID=344881 RepID=UPI00041CFB57|nr:CCC motif membrane protein [Flavobacterium soli]